MTIPLLILCISFTVFLLLGVPVAFSIEHIIALAQGREVEPAWG